MYNAFLIFKTFITVSWPEKSPKPLPMSRAALPFRAHFRKLADSFLPQIF